MTRLKTFAARVAKKTVKTFAQTLGAMLTAAGTGILDTDWRASLSVAGMAALLCVLMNIGDGAEDPP